MLLRGGLEILKYRAIIKKSGDWWFGWLVDLPGVNAQEKRYRILDAKGKTMCYVKPVGAAKAVDMTPYYGKKVGLVGQIKAHPAAAGALVEFTAVTLLD